MSIFVWTIVCLVVTVFASVIIETMRPSEVKDKTLSWAPSLQPNVVDIGGHSIRYFKTGEGSPVLLLHTFSTEISQFQHIIPTLAKNHTVYAIDLPGYGREPIKNFGYTAEEFADIVSSFLRQMDLENVTLVGESIGGSISLILAARHHEAAARVVSVNPMGYAGNGFARSSFMAAGYYQLTRIPVLGGTVARLRNSIVSKPIYDGMLFKGGMDKTYFQQLMVDSGRKGYGRSQIKFFDQMGSWEDATSEFGSIDIPVILLWGEKDWSLPEQRQPFADQIPGVKMKTISESAHFMALDRPDAYFEAIAEVKK